MMPNIPLHSLMEPSWTVPRDENLECSLFALEEQEKEYHAHLDRIANIAAPEPIGTRQSTINAGSNVAHSIRFVSGSSTRPRATRRNRRSSGSATPTRRSSYEYPVTTPGSRPSSAATSRGSIHRRFIAASDDAVNPSPMGSTALERSRWERSPSPSTLRRDSMDSFDDTEMG
jgi:hypothetical protein